MAKITPFEKYPKRYDSWFEKKEYVYKSELKALKKIFPSFKKGIEIGVGSGRFAGPLGIKFGIEPSEKMRKIAKSRGIEVSKGVAENIPIKDWMFDLVLMVTTLCFLDNTKKAFKEIHRILKPSGFFINGIIDKESLTGKSYIKNKEQNVFYKDANFFSVNEVISHLKKAGFGNFISVQTIFKDINQINKIEPVKEGHGLGSFVVIRAQKKYLS